MIDGDGLQFAAFRPKENFLEEMLISVQAVTVLSMMVLGGAALMMRFPVWWGCLAGVAVGGAGCIGLLAGLVELIRFLCKTADEKQTFGVPFFLNTRECKDGGNPSPHSRFRTDGLT